MRQPPLLADPDRPKAVCRLHGSLYGLKMAPRVWNDEVVKFFSVEYGLHQSAADPCVFVRQDGGGRPVLVVVVYVDDFLILGHSKEVESIKGAISAKWKTTDKGECTAILGLSIARDRSKRTLVITAPRYIEEACESLALQHLRPRSSPMEVKNGFDDCDLDELYCWGGRLSPTIFVCAWTSAPSTNA